MIKNEFLDEEQIRKTVSIIRSGYTQTDLFEIRIFGGRGGKSTVGYFKSVDLMIENLKRQNLKGKSVYITLNEIKDECYSRNAGDRFLDGEIATADKDIYARRWLLVDLDPERSSGISATDEQVAKAKQRAQEVYSYLEQQGFSEPLIGFSGNGYHLLYSVKLAHTKENDELVSNFLNALDILFTDDFIKIDKANKNSSRICKLYGTLAQKGRNTETNPHRMSRIVYTPKRFVPVDVEYIKQVTKVIPQPDKPQKYNNFNGEKFDLVAWMQKHGLHYRVASASDGTKYILDHCPFDESHKGKDAMIFQGNNGAIGFHCFHDSCSDKTWRDVRVLFEPDAYERKWQQQEQQMYGHYNRDRQIKSPPEPMVETPDNPIWYTPMDVFNLPKEEVHYIKTGYEGIDQKLYGLKKKAISVLTGLRSAGKSTWLDGLILNAIQDGNTVGCYSGELDEKNFMRWLIRQAAGRSGVEAGRYEGQWNVPYRNQKAISEWLQGKFYLYNNHHGNNYEQIREQIKKKINEDKLDLMVIDNLMALDIGDLSYQQLDAQKKFVLSLKTIAVESDVHILFVAHPRKTVSFLRLEDISGSGDLANAVDNAFLIHRNNEDFKLRSKEMFKWGDDHIAYSGTNVIEVAKDRESGTQDWFIPLWYEVETKRLKNSLAENILYGWRSDTEHEADGFMDLPEDSDPVFE